VTAAQAASGARPTLDGMATARHGFVQESLPRLNSPAVGFIIFDPLAASTSPEPYREMTAFRN
jgi:hypothetical protein